MTDRYAVIGNPVAHSRSPQIHAMFARATGQDLVYERLWAPLDGFRAAVDRFRAEGGRGLNVTLPFKLEAHAYADAHTPRAEAAAAVNTLRFDAAGVLGDNTDGVGLVTDIEQRLGVDLRSARVLIAGAGGAARGVLAPLLAAGVSSVTIANRTAPRAHDLAAQSGDARVAGCGYQELDAQRFEIVVNATSIGLDGGAPPLSAPLLGAARLVYDMVYATQPTALMRAALAAGCASVSDGLGMLIEQAAESFLVWRGVRPPTAVVYRALRAALAAEAGPQAEPRG
ncbi:MAG: shikimate dehydrogenase [Burkholderiales bacterium]|nr:MAG: shikimate dehydrogenase [Burkholderiales bacterium]